MVGKVKITEGIAWKIGGKEMRFRRHQWLMKCRQHGERSARISKRKSRTLR